MRDRILSSVLLPAPFLPMMPTHLAPLDLERDVLQRPETSVRRVECRVRPTSEPSAVQRCWSRSVSCRVCAAPIWYFLRDLLYADGDVTHYD